MVALEEHTRLRHLLEGAVPEVSAEGKWTHVQARVRHLRRRRWALGAGSVALALAVVVSTSMWVWTELAPSAHMVVITAHPGVESATTAPAATSSSHATLTPGVDYTFGGLWTTNVETVPAHPTSLPAEFFQRPGEAAPTLKGKPVWIFANELTPQQVVQAVQAVTDPWRTIVVYRPPVELDSVINMPGLFHLADLGTVPSIFTSAPLLVCQTTLKEVAPMWQIGWANTQDPAYGTGEVATQRLVYLACASLTLGGEFINENFLRAHPEVAAQRKAAAQTSTTEDPGYPREVSQASADAQALAQQVTDHVLAQTGKRLVVSSAVDTRVIGPGEKVTFVQRRLLLASSEDERAKVDVAFFRLSGDQLGPYSADSVLSLTHRFDAGPGSRGVLVMVPGRNSYQAILQLADETTVNAGSDGVRATQANVAAPLDPEQLIELVKWLATSATPPPVP